MNREYPVENFTIKDDYIDILYRDSETRLLEFAQFNKYAIKIDDSSDRDYLTWVEEEGGDPKNVILHTKAGRIQGYYLEKQFRQSKISAYKKHFLGLSDNVSYFVEQMEPIEEDPYHYKVIFKPEEIIPDIEMSTN